MTNEVVCGLGDPRSNEPQLPWQVQASQLQRLGSNQVYQVQSLNTTAEVTISGLATVHDSATDVEEMHSDQVAVPKLHSVYRIQVW